MSNERLRAAIAAAGLNTDDISGKLAVDPKTVERWITQARVPHRRHRLALAGVLGRDETYLWPSIDEDPRTKSASQAEFVAIHPNRGAVSANTWAQLLDQARESVDLLAFAASFLHDAVPDFDSKLAAKAREGVQVRLLFADPASQAVKIRGEEEGIGDLLGARCRLTWNYFKPLIDVPGVLARTHSCTVYNSVYRFDDALLSNTHVFGAPASQSPLIHVERLPGGRLFANYMLGFDRTWDRGSPVTAADLP